MSNLTERLRDFAWVSVAEQNLKSEAADRIDTLETRLAAIDALHRRLMGGRYCAECDNGWPCPTRQMIHMEETP